MNEIQIVVMLIGIFAVLLVLIAWAQLYGSGWIQVSQNVAGLSAVIVIFALVVGGVFMAVRGKK
jgi:hypothetical protein